MLSIISQYHKDKCRKCAFLCGIQVKTKELESKMSTIRDVEYKGEGEVLTQNGNTRDEYGQVHSMQNWKCHNEIYQFI